MVVAGCTVRAPFTTFYIRPVPLCPSSPNPLPAASALPRAVRISWRWWERVEAGQLGGEPRSQAQIGCGFLRQFSSSCPGWSSLWRLRGAEAKTCSVTRAACLLLQHVAADATLSTALFCKIQAERHGIAPKRGREEGGRDNARLHSVIVGYYLRSLVSSKRGLAIVTCLSCRPKRVVDSGTSRRSIMGSRAKRPLTSYRFVRGDRVQA
jgi:hypothetical protein